MLNIDAALKKARELGLLEDSHDGNSTRPTELGLSMWAVLDSYIELVQAGFGHE